MPAKLTGLSDFRLQTGSSGINVIANIDWTISPSTTSDNSDDSTSESQHKFRANKTRQQIAHGVPIIPPSLSIFTRTSSPNGLRQIRIVTAAKRPACITPRASGLCITLWKMRFSSNDIRLVNVLFTGKPHHGANEHTRTIWLHII